MTFDEAYSKLNPEQKTAVDSIEGPMMVLAGPGTGKTQILTLRIARILKDTQMSPQNILCLTFTESGVAAMRKRLFEFIGTPAYYVRIHTFHSFCNEIIKQNPEKFLFARELESLTDIESVQVFQAILDKAQTGGPLKPFADPYFYQRDIAGMIKNFKREDLSPELITGVLDETEATLKKHGAIIEAFCETRVTSLTEADFTQLQLTLAGSFLASAFTHFDLSEKTQRTEAKKELKGDYEDAQKNLPKQRALVELYNAYQTELKKRGRYDYEDMILMVVRKIKEDADLLANLQEQFQYLLVDEYQDTNGAQNEVVDLLASFYEAPSVFVVGDDKQSIYRFQGASLENMLAFYKRYKANIELVSLQNNYRSQQTILDAATRLIRHNEQGLETLIPELHQTLHSQAGHPATKLIRQECATPADERSFILESVQKLIAAGTEPREIAVLYRNNADADALEELFLRAKVPFHIFSGKDILKDKKIQSLLRLLTWLSSPTDDRELFLLLNADFLKLPALELLKLSRKAADARQPLLDAMGEAEKPFQLLREKLAEWQKEANNKTLVDFFELVINDSGYLSHLMAQESRIEQLNRLNTFFDQLKAWCRANPKLTLEGFVELLQLHQENRIAINEAELSTQKNAVALMTAHRSKGLEFEHVFLMNAVDKHWGNNPDRSKIKAPAGLLKSLELLPKEKNEDERRLFYVAMTRAKKSLTFTLATTNENGKAQTPSLFLEELGTEGIERRECEDETPNPDQLEQRLLLNFQPIVREVSQEERDYVKSLLHNYTLSVTHLTTYLRCPRLFYYKVLLRAPRAKTKEAAFGTAVHEALKDLLLANKRGGATQQLFLDSFERHLRREILREKNSNTRANLA
ncbi:ATP-dependent helicase [Candidatus Peregrinibacteria bacterium]|nr:MAG: ATP-dependent helicase [Candidatus Peregrinibacteria bacterium]